MVSPSLSELPKGTELHRETVTSGLCQNAVVANGKERFTVWKILEKILMACIIGLIAGWSAVLGTICSEPLEPSVTTSHTIPFNCHGTVVYITPIRSALLTWLIPMCLLMGLAWKAARKLATPKSTWRKS